MSKWTPGNWFVEVRTDRFAVKTLSDSHAIAAHREKDPECKWPPGNTIAETHIKYNGSGRAYGPNVVMTAEEAAANAQLMSAAPDMAEALCELLAHDGEIAYSGIGTEHDSDALETAKKKAIAALKKAGLQP